MTGPARPTSYRTTITTDRPLVETIEAVRAALGAEGFGVLTEIDVRATFKAKLGIDVPAQVILGACNPALAHRALEVEPSLGTLLPCNVVVREDQGRTTVEAVDPSILVAATGNDALAPIAREVSEKLSAALQVLASNEMGSG